MRLQLWSYNYDPEPQGIGPLSAILAQGLGDLGHDVLVVAAHPHYPEPVWGLRVRPYREYLDGVSVLRLPLWPGRGTSLERIRQEASFTLAQTIVAPLLPPADVVIAVTPSFPALAPMIAYCGARQIPWVMWLQDIVTDGAATTRTLSEAGRLLRAARLFERRTYSSANRIVVISDAFRDNLLAKGVSSEKIERIYNPSSRTADKPNDIVALANDPLVVLAMGNIGQSQGLQGIVSAFQDSAELRALDTRLVIAGSGVAAAEVRARVVSERITMPGVLYGADFTPMLRRASIGLVSQRAGIVEFNLPSKLMNYMAFGIPVIASVNPDSETARIVRESGAGWVTDPAHPEQFAAKVAEVAHAPEALVRASHAGFDFARAQFASAAVADRFNAVLHAAKEG